MAATTTIRGSQGLNLMSKIITDTRVMVCCSICNVELTMLSALTSAWRLAFCRVS